MDAFKSVNEGAELVLANAGNKVFEAVVYNFDFLHQNKVLIDMTDYQFGCRSKFSCETASGV